jgi:hypothetical protein
MTRLGISAATTSHVLGSWETTALGRVATATRALQKSRDMVIMIQRRTTKTRNGIRKKL